MSGDYSKNPRDAVPRQPSRSAKKRKRTRTDLFRYISIALVVMLFASYLIYQIVTYSISGIDTQIALYETVYKTIDTKCFVLRDEEYIESSEKGTMVSFAQNGERVASGDTVSRVFADSADADIYLKISELEKDIAKYEKLDGQANVQAVDIASLDFKIGEELALYLKSLDNRDIQAAASYAEQFGNTVTNKQIAMGTELDYSEKLAALRDELNSLKSKKLVYSEVTCDRAGYFISGTDGYEKTLDYTKIDEYTVDDIEKAISSAPAAVSRDTVGRTVGRFKWFILTAVDSDATVDIKNGQTVFVNLPYSGVSKLETKVYKVGDRKGDKTELILSCEDMNDSLTDIRIEDIQIITGEYSGLKIMNSSIRTDENGQLGVHIQRGTIVNFKKIHICYSTDEYSIVDNPENEEGFISLYDKVITKGVEMYDNKRVPG